MELKQEIIAWMGEIAAMHKIDRKELVGNGSVYYMNALNGTEFDAYENRHLPRFTCFWRDGEWGAITVFVNANGTMDGYYYEKGATQPTKEHVKRCPVDFKELTKEMLELDQEDKWDAKVGRINDGR